MAQHDGEHFALCGFESLRQIGLDLVADEPGRASVLKPLAGDMQHVAQEGDTFALAERLSERHAISDAAGGRAAHRFEDEIRAAELEKGAMAVVALRRAVQKLDRGRLAT